MPKFYVFIILLIPKFYVENVLGSLVDLCIVRNGQIHRLIVVQNNLDGNVVFEIKSSLM